MWARFNNVKPSIHSQHVLNAQQSSSFQVYTGVSEPIALTSNYYFGVSHNEALTNAGREMVADDDTYYYTRSQNPNYSSLEETFGSIHGGAVGTVAFASGMAAISAVIMSLTNASSEIVVSDEVYTEVPHLYDNLKNTNRIKKVHVVDVWNTDDVIERCNSEQVKILYFESASNPNMKIPDFEALVAGVRKVNPACVIVCDNTLLTPVLFRPFEFGIDIVVESATKYLSGKGDVLMGLASVRKGQGDVSYRLRGIYERIKDWRSITGGSPSPMNCWLVAKGIETLQLRMTHVSKSAKKVAKFLESLPCVSRVLYAGLKSHPFNERCEKYFKNGCGGLLRMHLPINSHQTYLTLEKDRAPFVNAVSFGEAHTLMMIGYPGSSNLFPHEKASQKVENILGYWYRIAIGLQSADEICHGFLTLFCRHEFSRCLLGDLSKVSTDGTLKIKGSKQASSESVTLGPEDVVFTINKNKQFQFFDLAEATKIKSAKIKLKTVSPQKTEGATAIELAEADGTPLPVYRLLHWRYIENNNFN